MLFKIGVLIYGYFAGALIQAGYWMGKFNKIDIRDYGSGNAGTTNVMRNINHSFVLCFNSFLNS